MKMTDFVRTARDVASRIRKHTPGENTPEQQFLARLCGRLSMGNKTERELHDVIWVDVMGMRCGVYAERSDKQSQPQPQPRGLEHARNVVGLERMVCERTMNGAPCNYQCSTCEDATHD